MTLPSNQHAEDPVEVARQALADAVEALAADGCVAFPSETVWGLAARARSQPAITALEAVKGRPEGQPISILVSGPDALEECGFEVGSVARSLMEEFWPGPLTLVLPCRSIFAQGIARGDGSVGVRCSSHPLVAQLVALAEAGGLGPLTATSCNRSGEPPARSEGEARALAGDSTQALHILPAGPYEAGRGAPTTVVDLSCDPPRVLREGGISAEALQPWAETLEGVNPDPAAGRPHTGDVSA